MKSILGFSILALGLSATVLAAEPSLQTDQEKISYVVGFQIGSQLKQQGFDVDINALNLAVQDALAGTAPRLSEQEAREVMERQQQQLAQAQEQKAVKNAEEGKAFLEANKAKSGVVVLDSGLQYKVVEAGTGKKPAEADTVTVNYRGTLIDGTEFDSSFRRGEPATFPLNRVIPGWTEALQLMAEGAKWQVYIPPELAYGARGAGAEIGPNSTLVFDIELIKVEETPQGNNPHGN